MHEIKSWCARTDHSQDQRATRQPKHNRDKMMKKVVSGVAAHVV